MRHLIIYLMMAFSLTSCFEEDVMVPPHEEGDLTVGKVELTENYKYQVFYDLETNSSISKNLLTDWDLGFETADSGWHVILNTSKMMLAGNSGITDFNLVKSKKGVVMNFDPSYGNLDSTAIGNWYSVTDKNPVTKGFVYIIDRGMDENSNTLGDKKISLSLQDQNNYVVRFANLNGTAEKTVTIPKDTTVNFVCFSFDKGIVNIEPDKKKWDLQFCRYSTLLFTDAGDPYPYLVTGVLLNPFNTLAEMDTTHQFDEVDFNIAEKQNLVKQKDIIGYEWKVYDFDNGMYTVKPENIYILKSSTGYLYKLRFIDYYNSTGEQGYPAFEFLRL